MSKDLTNSFDDFIKQSIGDHQIPYDDETWSLLEQKMSQVGTTPEELSVDETARQALSEYQVPYNHTTWQVLSDRLDRMSYRKRLIASKIFEAAVIFFAIFTMVKFLGQIPQVQEYLPKSFAQTQQSDLPEVLPNAGSDYALILKDDVQITEKSELSSSANEASLSSVSLDQDQRGPAGHRTDSDPVRLNQPSYLAPLVIRPGLILHSDKNSRRTTIHQLAIDTREFELPSVKQELNRPHLVKSVPLLPVFDMAMLEAETATQFHLAIAQIPTSKIKTKIGLFHQYNTHLINNYISGSPVPKQQIKSSAGNGIMTNVQFGRFGFDLGATYSEVTYSAGYGENRIQKLEIPLQIRYIGIRSKYADFYAKAGASAHGVLRAYYSDPGLSSRPGRSATEPDFNDGLLEEPGYREFNTYYSMNAGIGVDLPIYKAMSLFAEANYLRHWKGELGYTADRFTTFSYNFGASLRL
jgi:hypothetical protein